MTTRYALAAAGLALVSACEIDGSCFAATTRIATPRGPRPIRDLAVGDEVWSYDHAARRFAVGRVTAVHRSRGEIRSLRANDAVLRAVTGSHPIFVVDRGEFVAAAAIAPGHTLLHWDGNPESLPAARKVVELASPAPGDLVEVLNLTVGDGYSTFFADEFYVHNKSPIADCGTGVTIEAPRRLCVGIGADLKARNWCSSRAPDGLVFATSDPSVLVLEGNKVRAVAPGVATVTALVDGVSAGKVVVTVERCVEDGGPEDATDADAADADAAEAPPTDAGDAATGG